MFSTRFHGNTYAKDRAVVVDQRVRLEEIPGERGGRRGTDLSTRRSYPKEEIEDEKKERRG